MSATRQSEGQVGRSRYACFLCSTLFCIWISIMSLGHLSQDKMGPSGIQLLGECVAQLGWWHLSHHFPLRQSFVKDLNLSLEIKETHTCKHSSLITCTFLSFLYYLVFFCCYPESNPVFKPPRTCK